MAADVPTIASSPESLMAFAARWALDATPRVRSLVAAGSFVTMGLSLLAIEVMPLMFAGTGALGVAALSVTLWGSAAASHRRRPQRILVVAGRGLAGLALAAIGIAAAAFLLALLGKPWIS